MKKLCTAVLVCALAVLTLAACGRRTDGVKAVEAQIKAIGEITLDSAGAVSDAERAYAALSADEQKAVRNFDDLQNAAARLKALQETFAAYDGMNDTIAVIADAAAGTFPPDGTDLSALIERGETILAQYEDLDDAGKAYVRVTDELSEAVEALKESVRRTEQSAAEYVKAFLAVYGDEGYEVSAVFCIKTVRDETEFHVFALTYTDAAGDAHNVYANARCSANTNAATIENNADTFFAQKAVSPDYDAVENGNVTLDTETVLALAG